MASILVVDDEPGVRSSVAGVLSDEGLAVDTAASGEECLERAAAGSYGVIVLDIWLPGIDGLTTLQRLTERGVDARVVMMSGHGSIEQAVKAIKLGAFDFVEKPLSLDKTVLVVRNALRQHRLERENRDLRARVETPVTLVGDSPAMRTLRRLVETAGPSLGRVLILGENGTGKEVVARLIHQHSARRNRPFVEVNCAAIPEHLIEAEFFGARKGAYTGATQDRPGFFEAARGGTLFLDEIGDLPLLMQAKLLRAIQERRIRPLGSVQEEDVDVRLVSATHRDLSQRVHEGVFRQDLFYRLNVIEIRLPALRERSGDVPGLIRALLLRLCGPTESPPTLSVDAMD